MLIHLHKQATTPKTPLQAIKDWHKLKPELFRKKPCFLAGCDRHAARLIVTSGLAAGDVVIADATGIMDWLAVTVAKR